ncbi:MAG: tetratricopeptide repeat protein [Coxiellaceae bacterium]|nr:tetratricopeptide repeat protein [Coxiellaceae bacterium]
MRYVNSGNPLKGARLIYDAYEAGSYAAEKIFDKTTTLDEAVRVVHLQPLLTTSDRSAETLFAASLCYLLGVGGEQSDSKAASLLKCVSGMSGEVSARAQTLLGWMYGEKRAGLELGSELERKQAQIALYQQAAKKGLASAQYRLAMAYRDEVEVLGVSDQADRNNLAIDWCLQAVSQDFIYAKVCLASMYERGLGRFVNDAGEVDYAEIRRQVERLYGEAAEQGSAEAQHKIGMKYKLNAMGADLPDLARDAKAVEWLQKAVEQKYVPAMLDLALMYLNERVEGVDSDFESYFCAGLYYRDAATLGNAEAKFRLAELIRGRFIEAGLSPEKRNQRVIQLYAESIMQGYAKAAERLADVDVCMKQLKFDVALKLLALIEDKINGYIAQAEFDLDELMVLVEKLNQCNNYLPAAIRSGCEAYCGMLKGHVLKLMSVVIVEECAELKQALYAMVIDIVESNSALLQDLGFKDQLIKIAVRFLSQGKCSTLTQNFSHMPDAVFKAVMASMRCYLDAELPASVKDASSVYVLDLIKACGFTLAEVNVGSVAGSGCSVFAESKHGSGQVLPGKPVEATTTMAYDFLGT